MFAQNARNLHQIHIIGQHLQVYLTLQASSDPHTPVHTLEIMRSTPASYHTLSNSQVAQECPQQPSLAPRDPQHTVASSPPSPCIPLCLSVEPNQRLCAHIIALSKQLRDVDVQRAVWLSTGQQLVYARHGRRDGVCGRPARLEQVEADLARLEVDVGVADGREEADGGRRVGVGGRDVDVEEPCAAWVRLMGCSEGALGCAGACEGTGAIR